MWFAGHYTKPIKHYIFNHWLLLYANYVDSLDLSKTGFNLSHNFYIMETPNLFFFTF